MINLSRCSWAVGLILVARSVSAAEGSPAVAINPDHATAVWPVDELPGHDSGRLETVRPYERGKIPVVFIHGLWGSPQTWDQMIEDPRWQPYTPDELSILDVPLCKRRLDPLFGPLATAVATAAARQVCDPAGIDAALDQMVLVGHSLGGILAKLMAQSGGPLLWQTVCSRPLDDVIAPTEYRQLLHRAFFYTPVREVAGLSS